MYDVLTLQKWALILFVRESAQYYPTPYCCIPFYTHIFDILERLENTNQDTVRTKAVKTIYIPTTRFGVPQRLHCKSLHCFKRNMLWIDLWKHFHDFFSWSFKTKQTIIMIQVADLCWLVDFLVFSPRRTRWLDGIHILYIIYIYHRRGSFQQALICSYIYNVLQGVVWWALQDGNV